MKIDYFKLPFEVHYNDSVEVTSCEFISDVKVEKFSDIKILRKQQGVSFNPIFVCTENSGPELYCCIINGHDEVQPDWLCISSEDDVRFNYATSLKVVMDTGQIGFEELSDEELDEDSEEFLDVENMDYCDIEGFMAYELETAAPDYLILDASRSRVKVNLEGYVLSDEGEVTDERIFDLELLRDIDELHDYSSRNIWEAKAEWVKSVLAENFPDETILSLK